MHCLFNVLQPATRGSVNVQIFLFFSGFKIFFFFLLCSITRIMSPSPYSCFIGNILLNDLRGLIFYIHPIGLKAESSTERKGAAVSCNAMENHHWWGHENCNSASST